MKIIPKPQSITERDGVFEFSSATGVADNVEGAWFLNDFLKKTYGFELKSGNDISVEVENVGLGQEGYVLDVTESGVKITAITKKGMFHGVISLLQLVFEYADKSGTAKIPCVTIKDNPRFGYRAFMLDCCRHFFGVDVIKKLLDACALHKLSVFHWHLTEDQGWRIQIDKYPKLTEVGSKRAETRKDGIPHGGYFSKADVQEIISYAAERFIEVIPEIDMPGHMRAAIAAYPELGCSKKPTEVATRFGVHTEILCGGRDATYEFVYGVLDEIAEMFPSKYIHLGGDEAPKIEWRNCPDCQKKVEDEGLASIEQLQGYFTNKVINYLKTLGKVAICWNESLHGGNLASNAVVQYWMAPNKGAEPIAAANNGRKIIISKFNPYYLDYPYGLTSLKATYRLEPRLPEFTDEGAKNILGVESPLWTEYVADFKQVQYQVFPRLTAVAESGWTLPENKNYKCFMQRLPNMRGMLAQYGFNVVPDNEANPNFIKGKCKMLKFFINMAKPEDMARQRAVFKDTKAMRKEQKEIGKK